MRKIEIRRIGVLSTWKVTTYMMVLPAILCFLMGLAIALIGICSGQTEMIFMGILMALVYPIMFVVIYGPMAMLMTLIYNLFSGKFGGLKITIKEEEPEPEEKK